MKSKHMDRVVVFSGQFSPGTVATWAVALLEIWARGGNSRRGPTGNRRWPASQHLKKWEKW